MSIVNEVAEYVDLSQLKHLKFEVYNGEYTVSLIDATEYEIVRGYGNTVIEALNDLHAGLV